MSSLKRYNLKVEVDSDRGAERAIKKFKRMCESFGVSKEYRARKEHRKPSVRKKEKRIAAEKKRSKLQRKEKMMMRRKKI